MKLKTKMEKRNIDKLAKMTLRRRGVHVKEKSSPTRGNADIQI
ncbi:hypothetical protein [Klebsiella variicola]